MAKKRSFFERITGGIRLEEDTEDMPKEESKRLSIAGSKKEKDSGWIAEEEEEGQLTVDVYQTPSDIIVEAMVAGVKPEDLEINITRDMVTVRGKRAESKVIDADNYYVKELYWGSFSRTISLPQEVEVEEAEAMERHGLLTIKLPKIDKNKQTNLRVKSI